MKTKKSFMLKCFLFLLLLLGILSVCVAGIIYCTEEGYEPRNWLVWTRQAFLALWGVAFLGMMIASTTLYCRRISSLISKVIFSIIFWIPGLLFFAMLLTFLISGCPWDVEIKDFGNTILVEQPTWLDKTTYAIYEKEGLFYRKWVRKADADGNELEEILPKTLLLPSETDKSLPDYHLIIQEQESREQQEQEMWQMEEGARAICESLPENLKGSGEVTETFDAKGNPQWNLPSQENNFTFLRFDRPSENEKCLLYVLYQGETQSIIEAEIVDMYAYSIEDKQVIASGKTNWGDSGTEEYQKATGEG